MSVRMRRLLGFSPSLDSCRKHSRQDMRTRLRRLIPHPALLCFTHFILAIVLATPYIHIHHYTRLPCTPPRRQPHLQSGVSRFHVTHASLRHISRYVLCFPHDLTGSTRMDGNGSDLRLASPRLHRSKHLCFSPYPTLLWRRILDFAFYWTH